jgi:peptidoglycan hydrolase-like protein with peptidoglycan-binding domain
MRQSRRRLATAAGWFAVVAVMASASFLAGRWTFNPPAGDQADGAPQSITIAEGTVGDRLAVTVDVTWKQSGTGVNPASGTVTTTQVRDTPVVKEGDVLYSVDLRPVVAALGAVPSFRDLAQGIIGVDVAQLQQFLTDKGYYSGPADGKFGRNTASAVEAWQRSLGVEPTGVVAAGALLFFPELPAQAVPNKELFAGAIVTAGQELLSTVDSTPVFSARLGTDQISRIPAAGAGVIIAGPGSPWDAQTGSIHFDDTGKATMELLPAKGDSICASECGLLEVSESAQSLNASVILTADISGPIVPISALGTDATGGTFVIDLAGTRISVTVLGSDGSQAVIDGPEVGEIIRLFAVDSPDANRAPARPEPSGEPTQAPTS